MNCTLSGVIRLQHFFDVGDEIDLEELRRLLRVPSPAREPSFRHQAPDYVRFERPPVEDRAEAGAFQARLRYFDYGVVAIEMEQTFQDGWAGLVALAAKWVDSPELEDLAAKTVRRELDKAGAAIRRPAERLLSEDYTVIELRRACGEDGHALNSSQLLARFGAEIAQVVRGEQAILSESERHEVLASSMSYSPNDLLVVGWTAALVYDNQPDGATPTLQLLEYANTQLLEFRHYDVVLTAVLKNVYDLLARKKGILGRWRMAREAERLNALLLEIRELTERTDNAIKFLSDMFYARAYRLAAARIGVGDYRALVDSKLRTANDLYRFLMDEFHQARAFVLELMIVIILIIDLIFLFRGKST